MSPGGHLGSNGFLPEAQSCGHLLSGATILCPESCESLTVRSDGKSSDDSQKWATLRNWLFKELLRCAITHSLTLSLTYSSGEIKIKQIVALNEGARESFTGRFQYRFHQLTVYFQCVWSLSGFSLLSYLRLCEDVDCACHYRAPQVETVCFDIPSCRRTSFCSLCTTVFHCGMLSSFAGLKNQSVLELFA